MKNFTTILIGLLLTAFLTVTLIFANGFFGNPISKAIVNYKVKGYISTTYPDLNLQVEKAQYNFKFSSYSVNAYSPSSLDTHFNIYFDSYGNVERDDYDSYVLGKFNTRSRLEDSYRNLTDAVFDSDSFPYDTYLCFGELTTLQDSISEEDEILGLPQHGYDLDAIELDGDYDIKQLGKTAGQLVFYTESEDRSVDNAVKILNNVKQIFDEADVPFCTISFVLEMPRDIRKEQGIVGGTDEFRVKSFPYSEIGSEQFKEKLIEANQKLMDYYAILDSQK